MSHSYYIPSIKKSHSVDYIASQINTSGLGIVTRVDFTPLKRNKNMSTKLQSAFIHCDSDPAWEQQETELVTKILDGQSHRLNFFNSSEYWIILKARDIIPQTKMNASQIVDKCTFLENKVLELEAILTNTNQVIYQLVCGLYSPLKQESARQHLLELLPKDSKPISFDSDNNKYMWSWAPTTVQGMECEMRLNILQLQVNDIQHNLTNNQCPETQPPLIDDDSDTDYSYNMNVDMVTWD
jgi:hypothetical protein